MAAINKGMIAGDFYIPEEDIVHYESYVKKHEDPKMSCRKTILSDAERVICSDRQDQYGNAEDSFDLISEYWNLYLKDLSKVGIDSYDVAMMMILLKIARSQANPNHADNYIDICGYAALAAELAITRNKNNS